MGTNDELADRHRAGEPCNCDGLNGGECRSVGAGRHLWSHETLACTRRDCRMTWERHQRKPAECRGTNRPAKNPGSGEAIAALRLERLTQVRKMRKEGVMQKDMAERLKVVPATIYRYVQLIKRDEASEDRPGATIAP